MSVTIPWDVEFQKWYFLSGFLPEFDIYVSIQVKSQKKVAFTCNKRKKIEKLT